MENQRKLVFHRLSSIKPKIDPVLWQRAKEGIASFQVKENFFQEKQQLKVGS
ncbi:hypothetical protein ACT3TP_13760 [Glutamicibacter sp. AOP38-B1-38]|uniref:hypothetical protein n=1 Tax=Glutamicibacter sp. AOP38-B1-38 TaxID=3457680 RepID=UPI00403432F4